MDIGHIILGKPWLYNLDVTICGRSNSCSFSFQGKKIELIGLPPKSNDNNLKKHKVKQKELNIIMKFDKKVCVGCRVINRSIGMIPFKVIHGYKPRKPLDLLPMSIHVRVSESAKYFAQKIHDLRTEITKQIQMSNTQYKL